MCPYCGARNLDQQELVKHCMENHRNDPNRVVSAAGTGWLCAGRLLALQMQRVSGWFGSV